MASYTVTTNANEDKAIAFLLARENANRADANPPQGAITADQLVDGVVRRVLISGLRDFRVDEADRVRRAYDASNTATQNQIKSALGVT